MKYVLLMLPLLFVGCGIVQISKDYTPPSKKNKIINKTIINGSKDVVWKKVISNLSQNFFVVNNLDKESGFINVSYSGDPEEYVDGGYVHMTFSNLAGSRDYRFSGSTATTTYTTKSEDGTVMTINRKLDLDGRINVMIVSLDSTKCQISVNIKYIINQNNTGTDVLGRTLIPYNETISFNTGNSATSKARTEYCSNGNLETLILSMADESIKITPKSETDKASPEKIK
jgi:hypothetical protein